MNVAVPAPTGYSRIYDPTFIKFVPPGAALNVICGINVPAARIRTMPSKFTMLNAEVFVVLKLPPVTLEK